MRRKLPIKLSATAATFILLALLASCNVNEPVAPRWDVSLNVPLVNKTYTMYDILEKKSSEISHYTEGTNKNILYYTDVKKLDQISVNDKLNIDPFSEKTSQAIGVISIASDSILTDVGYEWVDAPVTPGSQAILPPVNNADFTQEFSGADEFKSALVETGNIEVYVTNHFPSPINITVNSMEIRNVLTGETIAKYTTPTQIPANKTVKFSDLPLAPGTTIRQNMNVICNVSASGSGGQIVTLPVQTLTIKAGIKNISVTEANGKIPKQKPFNVTGTLLIDENLQEPTMFNTVKLASGYLNLTLSNNMDIDAVAIVSIPNLKNQLGESFSQSITIGRKQQNVKVLNNYSLNNYSIVSASGSPSNKVSYSISATPLASDDYRDIKSTDDVVGDVQFTNLKVKEFSGQLKPTELTETRTSVSLNVKDLQDKLDFQHINLKNPIVELRLKPTADVEFLINGRMEARNSIGEHSYMTLSERTLNKTLVTATDSVITLNPDSVSAFFGKFTKFPDSLVVYAGGTVNPNYKTVNIKNTDQLTGTSRIEFPLEFGISNAEVNDSVEVELSNDDRDQIKDLNSFETSLKITNGIPADISFTGRLYDEFNNPLMYLRTGDQDTVITISGASTDANGNVISKTEQTLTIKSVNGDPERIAQAKYMRINLELNTTGQSNSPVKFKTDDAVTISAAGTINYQVKSNK